MLQSMYITRKFNSQNEKEKYDPLRCPPNLKTAIDHGQANRFAEPNEEIQNRNCPCCGFPIENLQLSLTCDRQDMGFNGAGVPLFFEFLLFTFILLSILSLATGVYNTIANKLGRECEKLTVCTSNFYNIYALSNREGEADLVLYILDLLAILAIIVATIVYRRLLNLTASEIDRAEITITDFSVQVGNLPLDANKEEIITFFSQIQRNGTKRLKIVNVNMGYNIKEYNKLCLQLIEKDLRLKNLQEDDDDDNVQQVSQLKQEIAALQDKINEYNGRFETKCQFSGTAFITYETSAQSRLVRKYYNLTQLQLMLINIIQCFKLRPRQKFRGQTPYVVRAPEPGDILWDNLGVDPWDQFKYQIYTNLASLLILGVCFATILGISSGQDSLNKQFVRDGDVPPTITILGLIASLVISLLNSVLGWTIKKLVNYEEHSTQTEFNISYVYKLGLQYKLIKQSAFINTAIIPLIVNLFINDESYFIRIVDRGGLNQDVLLIFIINAIFPWLYSLLNPFYIWRLIKQKLALKEGEACKLTQKQAQTLFEGPIGDLSEKYATVTKTILLTFFYAQLLPLGIFLSAGFVLCYYIIEKRNFLRRYARGPTIGSQLAQEIVDSYIELGVVLFAVRTQSMKAGNCIWQRILVGSIHALVWAQLGIALAQLLIPVDWISEWLCQSKEDENELVYDGCKAKLWDDYDLRNPATMQFAIEKLTRVQEINEQESKNQETTPGELNVQYDKFQKNNQKQENDMRNNVKKQNQKSLNMVLEQMRFQAEKNMQKAQHHIQKKININKKGFFNAKRANQIIPNNDQEHNNMLQPKALKQTQSIIIKLDKNEPKIKQADSFTYD